MQEIKEFMLPEHTNSLYTNEAISSIALTKEVAEKINELVKAYNELSRVDLNYKQEQEGKIRKAILYMKDNLINSLQDLMDMLLENGFIDTRIKSYCGDLNRRLDNLLGSIKKGSTTSSMDAEVIDARTGILSNSYVNLGDAIRGELKHVLMAHSGGTTFKNETIVADTGSIHPNDTRLLSSLIALTHYQSLTCDTLYQIRLFYYDAELNYVGSSDWGRYFDLTSIDKNVLFIRFVVAKRTNDLITIDDLEAIKMDLTKRNSGSGTGTSAKYQISNIEVFNGTITNSGSFDYRTNRLITRIVKADFTKIEVKDGYKLKIACYDANMQSLTGNDFKSGYLTKSDLLDGTEYMQVIVGNTNDSNELTPSDDTGLTIHSDLDLFAEYNKKAPAFIHELMNTAYSSINLGIANSKMHFDLSGRFGFNALKGDVRITKDNVLVMHHDAALKINSSGQLVTTGGDEYPFITNDWTTTLKDRTYKETLGYLPEWSQHICTFEEYIQLCVKHNKIAYITVRENNIPKVIELCMETLKKYNMLERCIFNSYEYEALQTVRKYSSTIPVSLVLKHEVAVKKGDIEMVACLGNAILTLFYAPSENIDTLLTSSTELFAYAKERNVILHMAQVSKYDDYIKCINAGIKGFHLLKPLQEHCVKYQLNFNWSGGQVTLLNEDLTATIELYDEGFTVSNVKKVGSNLEYDDGLPLILFIRENPCIQVTSKDWRNFATTFIAYYEMESLSIDKLGDFNGRITVTVIL